MADVFDALADAKRREILELVAAKPLTTAGINKSLKLTQPVLEKHLKMLVSTDLLTLTTKGKTNTYSLNRAGFTVAAKWFAKFGSGYVAGQAEALGESVANLLGNAATWLEGKLGTKINLDVDPEELGKEIGRKLSDAKLKVTKK